MRVIRICTRGSALALTQTDMVRSAIESMAPEVRTEVATVHMAGDILSEAPLDAMGGKGIFVKVIKAFLKAI